METINKNVQISVIVPVYNTEKYLKQCIESVLSQERIVFELIIVDDGSTDNSIAIIKSYASDPMVKTYYIKGKGPAEPRNVGLRHATGEYIYFLDSDDYILPDSLHNLYEAAIKFPQADFIKGNHRVLTQNGEIPTRFSKRRQPYADRILNVNEALTGIIHGHNIPCNILYKHSFLKEHNISFNEAISYLEDGPFLMKFFSFSPKSLYIENETYVYRLGAEGSVTNTVLTPLKVKSLILGALDYKALKGNFEAEAETERSNMEHLYVHGALSSMLKLKKEEAIKLFDIFKKEFPKLKNGKGVKLNVLIRTYNFSPFIFKLLFL